MNVTPFELRQNSAAPDHGVINFLKIFNKFLCFRTYLAIWLEL